MKLKIPFLIIILSSSLSMKAQDQYKLSLNCKDISFIDFVTKVENILPVKFYYKKEWVKDMKLGDYPDCVTLSCVLDNLLKGTSLYYYFDDLGNIILTKNYAVKVNNNRPGIFLWRLGIQLKRINSGMLLSLDISIIRIPGNP